MCLLHALRSVQPRKRPLRVQYLPRLLHQHLSEQTRRLYLVDGRPPVPQGLPSKRQSTSGSVGSATSPTRRSASGGAPTYPPPPPKESYVMVDEPDEFVDVGKDDGQEEVPAPQEEEHDAPPPLPPSRPVKRTSGSSHGHGHAPGRAVPPPPPAPATPTAPGSASASAASATGLDWELPSIPGSDLEMSWSGNVKFLRCMDASARDNPKALAPTSDDSDSSSSSDQART